MPVSSTRNRIEFLYYKGARNTSELGITVKAYKVETSKTETTLPDEVDITDEEAVYLGAAANVETYVGVDFSKLADAPGTYYVTILAGEGTVNQHAVARAEVDVNGLDAFTVRV